MGKAHDHTRLSEGCGGAMIHAFCPVTTAKFNSESSIGTLPFLQESHSVVAGDRLTKITLVLNQTELR